MEEFLAMGGYARFVWSAFGITAVVMILNVVTARRRFKRIHAELALHIARQDQIRNQS
jgi:heme exporter protein D